VGSGTREAKAGSGYITWREGRTETKMPKPGATRPEYLGARADGTILTDAVAPIPVTTSFQAVKWRV
jgi:hypothetical protein